MTRDPCLRNINDIPTSSTKLVCVFVVFCVFAYLLDDTSLVIDIKTIIFGMPIKANYKFVGGSKSSESNYILENRFILSIRT